MKLDCLANGPHDGPLIRLYDFTPLEARELCGAIALLASEAAERIEVHKLPFVVQAGACRLSLVRQTWDQAIVRDGGSPQFECGFTAATWDNVAGLIAPFAEGAGGFQWLAAAPGEADLLLSKSGDW